MAGSQPDKSQKTEKPTGRRLKKAYEKGNVPRSQDLGQTVSLGVFLMWGGIGGAAFIGGLASQVRRSLIEVGLGHSHEYMMDRVIDMGLTALTLLAPLLLALLAFALVGQVGQTGFHPKKHPIEIEFNKMDPFKGLKNVFSVKKIFAAGKALAKLFLYVGLALVVVVPEWHKIIELAFETPHAIGRDAASMIGRILFRALIIGILTSVIDYSFMRYRWVKDLYMSKQEIRDEMKENEGNPEVKGQRRTRQREMSRRRMMAAVKTADVVVTNPTHFAVALQYQRATMAAPVVVAKGRDRVALRIKEEARKHSVAIVEDPPLARTLERLCPLDRPIPESLFRAVAEVFAYVMGQRKGSYRIHEEVEREHEAEVTR